MYRELNGTYRYHAATGSGTFTLPQGAVMLQISVVGGAGASFSVFGGDTMVVPSSSPQHILFQHANAVAGSGTPASNQQIAYANVASIWVDYMEQPK